MLTFLAVVHVLIAFGVIFFVLLQDPKGGAAGMFGGGGGGSNTVFGTTGAATFLTKVTRWLAVLFAMSCILLVYMTTHGGKGSVLDDMMPAATTPAPITSPTSKEQPEGSMAPVATPPQEAAPAEPAK